MVHAMTSTDIPIEQMDQRPRKEAASPDEQQRCPRLNVLGLPCYLISSLVSKESRYQGDTLARWSRKSLGKCPFLSLVDGSAEMAHGS